MAAVTARTRVTRPTSSYGIIAARPFVLGISKVLFTTLSSVVSAAPTSVFERYQDDEPKEQGASLWVLYVASAVLVLLGGAFAGLTIAYVLCHLPSA